MKFSEINLARLDDDAIYDLMMMGLTDYAKQEPNTGNKADVMVVLGCKPSDLKPRVVKMMELYEKGFSKSVVFSGGLGWRRIKKQHQLDKDLANLLPDDVYKDAVHEGKDNKRIISYHRVHGNLNRLKRRDECDIAIKLMNAAEKTIEIDDDRIFRETHSTNTKENADNTKELFEKLHEEGKLDNPNNIMVITSAYHCRRAMLTFLKVFKELPGEKIMVCPATVDLPGTDFAQVKEILLKDEEFMKHLYGEFGRIIRYAQKGDICDVSIEEIVGEERAKQIEAMQAIPARDER